MDENTRCLVAAILTAVHFYKLDTERNMEPDKEMLRAFDKLYRDLESYAAAATQMSDSDDSDS